MDQAWELEQIFWKETSEGNATSFYARHMAADGFVVLPNRVVSRYELVSRWDQLSPVRSCELSEPTFTLIEGGNVVITYHVAMDADWLPDYRAWMTALYTWTASEWTLLFRAHTPEAAFPF
jgi:hypothetical protein